MNRHGDRHSDWHIGRYVWVILLAVLLPLSALADDASEASDKVKDAQEVIEDVMASPDKGIPKDLFKNVAGIAIFPGVMKAGFVLGGKYGRGVVLRYSKKHHTWTSPAFYSIGAASVGWQIGAQSTDLVLLIRSEKGLKGLLKNEFTLGADAAIAAGPVGRRAEGSIDGSFKAEIWSYSRSRGLFAGVSFEGAKINILADYNHAYYGKSLTPRDILFGGKARAPKSGVRLIHVLNKFSK